MSSRFEFRARDGCVVYFLYRSGISSRHLRLVFHRASRLFSYVEKESLQGEWLIDMRFGDRTREEMISLIPEAELAAILALSIEEND